MGEEMTLVDALAFINSERDTPTFDDARTFDAALVLADELNTISARTCDTCANQRPGCTREGKVVPVCILLSGVSFYIYCSTLGNRCGAWQPRPGLGAPAT